MSDLSITRKLELELARLTKENAELVAALEKAVEVIREWHNMDGSSDVWPIYLENAPEMQPIRAALAKVKS